MDAASLARKPPGQAGDREWLAPPLWALPGGPWCHRDPVRDLSFSPLPLASLLFSAICEASSDNTFAFMHFILVDDFDHGLLYNVRNFRS